MYSTCFIWFIRIYSYSTSFQCNTVNLLIHCSILILGDVTISGDVTLTVDFDLNGANPQFTLTCISTGGPATTVTWTRDSVDAVGNTETVLNNTETAQYTHTLTVTEILGGLYTCTVSNNKPSSDSANITLEGTIQIHY